MKDEIWSVPTELLDAASAEELRSFVLRQAEENILYKSALIQWLSTAIGDPRQSPDLFKHRVRRLFCRVREVPYRRYHDEVHVTIDWQAVNAGMLELAGELRSALEAGEVRVVPEVVPSFFRLVNEHSEELSKHGYDVLEESHDACAELLNTWQALPGIPEEDKRKLLAEVKDIARLRVYRKRMIYPMNHLIISLTSFGLPAHEAYRLIDSMQLYDHERWFADYHKIRLLYALGREAAAQKIIRRNITCNLIVDEEVERLIGADKLSDAMALAESAVKADVIGRKEVLLRKGRIAELMHDMPTILDTYEQIAMHGDSSLEAYHKLKSLTPTTEWPRRYRKIADELLDSGGDSYLAAILAEEGDSARLFKLLKNDEVYDQYNLIHEYLPQLPEKYHEPLLKICFATLWERVPSLKGHREYAEYTEEVKRFSQLPGARLYVDKLLSLVRTRYARKSALLHELSRV